MQWYICSQLQSFSVFAIVLKTTGLILINLWFLLCCGTLQPIVKLSKFSHFFAFFWRTTGLILIKLLFLFMLWHSTANCKVSKFSHFFCIFPRNYWSDLDQIFDFRSCCGTLQPVAKSQNFLSFCHLFLKTTGLILIKSLIFVYAVALCSQL